MYGSATAVKPKVIPELSRAVLLTIVTKTFGQKIPELLYVARPVSTQGYWRRNNTDSTLLLDLEGVLAQDQIPSKDLTRLMGPKLPPLPAEAPDPSQRSLTQPVLVKYKDDLIPTVDGVTITSSTKWEERRAVWSFISGPTNLKPICGRTPSNQAPAATGRNNFEGVVDYLTSGSTERGYHGFQFECLQCRRVKRLKSCSTRSESPSLWAKNPNWCQEVPGRPFLVQHPLSPAVLPALRAAIRQNRTTPQGLKASHRQQALQQSKLRKRHSLLLEVQAIRLQLAHPRHPSQRHRPNPHFRDRLVVFMLRQIVFFQKLSGI
ncbi:unnamed protein product [Nesidiocoris tenuis]|uniref:Uncharacterized protein n=1 Tax=Nesidiocoris tenuis TaxID=355587 RepID=A0A6H5HKL9_9HEMI|nr:unnamed protein product [Nesidiocoris tenuis]